ncbi:MAG: DDE-type integrase/transposase/recombinase [Candidatus Hydrogenedentes bacterium]|nr:DDE-type integrase/transposase/recombinase [Candidatus Hydrogenedentota bacterium]
MNKLSRDLQIQVANALCQGMSLRSITRLLNVHRTTIIKILERAGEHCESLQDQYMRKLDLRDIQADEIWTFVRKKQGRLTPEEKKDTTIGDQYVFIALERNTKLIPTWVIGKRNENTTMTFMSQLKQCMNGCQTQISTDAFAPYEKAVPAFFGTQASYAAITKEYESEQAGRGRYAPPRVAAVHKFPLEGKPDLAKATTSHIERQNLTLRTFQRRLTRLALGFSKKLANLKAACALHFAYYNFCWIPRTQKITPAMAAGLTDHVWTVAELVPEW